MYKEIEVKIHNNYTWPVAMIVLCVVAGPAFMIFAISAHSSFGIIFPVLFGAAFFFSIYLSARPTVVWSDG